MFQIVVFSKPLEEMADLLVQAAKEAAWLAEFKGTVINQDLISVEDVLLQNNAPPKHKIMIRYYPDFAPNHTHLLFVGEEFTSKAMTQAYVEYAHRPAALIDRTNPAQLMGAVMGHYYGIIDLSSKGEVKGHDLDGRVSLLVEGTGILGDMLVIKAAIDKEA